MGKERTPTAPHPLVERMLSATANGHGAVELRGYPGHSSPETLTLFLDLSLSRHLEIPQSAVLARVESDGTANGPTKVYVQATAQVVAARRLTAHEAAQALKPSRPVPRAGGWHLQCEDDPFNGSRYCWAEPGEE